MQIRETKSPLSPVFILRQAEQTKQKGRDISALVEINTPPKLTAVLTLSKLAHRQRLKRGLVGVGGLEVRGRQRLALTSVCHLYDSTP